jgi:arginine:pyruvate transaminase
VKFNVPPEMQHQSFSAVLDLPLFSQLGTDGRVFIDRKECVENQVQRLSLGPVREHMSIASLEGMAYRTLTIGSLSKSHAMTGWRLGWVVGPETAIGHLGRLALCMLYGLPGFIQQAGLAALDDRRAVVAQMREFYRRRRDVVFQRLSKVSELNCKLPEAGMFLMMDIRGTGLSTYDFTWQLFREKGVSLLDASLFGRTAAGYVRLGLVVDEQRLMEACDRIADFVARR